MKSPFFLLAISLMFCIQVQAQVSTEPPVTATDDGPVEESVAKDEEVYVMVDIMPEYTDGDESAFIQYVTCYVHKHVDQPKDSTSAVTGNMYIQFIIETDGSVSNASIYPGKGLNPAYDKAAIEAIKKSKWKPASRNGTPVRYRKLTRFRFY